MCSDLHEPGREGLSLSGDAEHVYVTDARGAIVSTHDTLAQAEAAMRCACKGTRRLDRMVLDGVPGAVECPWCVPLSGRSGAST